MKKIHVLPVVHNGIIENFHELKEELSNNEVFSSDTDTEVIAHLIEHELQNGSQPIEAVKLVVSKIKRCVRISNYYFWRRRSNIWGKKW